LDLEGKPVSNWKLEEYSRREWESRLRIIHPRASHGHTFPRASGWRCAAWQRLHHESTKL
jgi:hypothetical protein